ncbi:MAG: HAD family hydrolase [Trebonia sp.]
MPASDESPRQLRSAREVIGAWAAQPRRGVIFDFNGTLSDDEPVLLEIFTELFARHLGWSMPPSEYYGRLAGRSDREIIDTVVAEQAPGDTVLARGLLRLRRELYREKVARASPITDAAVALVRRLAASGIPLGIVTGAQRQDVLAVLDRSPAGEHITVLVSEEDVTEGKPDPEGFIRGARALGLSPGQILVFEDSVPGISAAAAAGMHCVAVAGTMGSARLAEVTRAVVPRLDPALLDT